MIENVLLKVTAITSFWFFVFAALVLLLYYIVPRRGRWLVLLLSSGLFFVLACNVRLYLLFTAQVLLAWGGVLLFSKVGQRSSVTVKPTSIKGKKGKKNSTSIGWLDNPERLQKYIIRGVVLVELAALMLMKQSLFFTVNARIGFRLLGIHMNIPDLSWAAPLGMSYYTLMLISYVLDVAWGTAAPQKNPLKIMLYAGFFPQMISGPFTRYNDISAQLYGGNGFDLTQFQYGLQRFLWGLFKKLVIAERLAVIVATIYGGGTEAQMGTVTFEGTYIAIAAISYVFQLYTDFSGCIDMVIGLAQMFGIKLPENFNTPFYSTSLSEFWRRWHMTLGLYLKDYVLYATLKSGWIGKIRNFTKNKWGKKASKDIPTYIGMFITWFGIGFWHGGSWKYICASGLFFFVMIVGGLILEPYFNKLADLLRINRATGSWTLFQRLRTVCLFTLSVSFGRALSLSDGFQMWGKAFKYNPWVLVDGSLYTLGLDMLDFWVMLFGLGVLFVVSKFQQSGSVRELIARQNLVFRWVLWLLLFAAVLLFGMYGEGYNPADFIYGGF